MRGFQLWLTLLVTLTISICVQTIYSSSCSSYPTWSRALKIILNDNFWDSIILNILNLNRITTECFHNLEGMSYIFSICLDYANCRLTGPQSAVRQCADASHGPELHVSVSAGSCSALQSGCISGALPFALWRSLHDTGLVFIPSPQVVEHWKWKLVKMFHMTIIHGNQSNWSI